MDMRRIVGQACQYSMNYVSMTVPSVNSWALRIKDAIDPYAVWILPCLYAALGSMIYYIETYTGYDTAKSAGLSHRASYGAGRVGWNDPGLVLGANLGNNSEFKSVGFGLFTFAFVVGFSIDVFFALLDRLVFISHKCNQQIRRELEASKLQGLAEHNPCFHRKRIFVGAQRRLRD